MAEELSSYVECFVNPAPGGHLGQTSVQLLFMKVNSTQASIYISKYKINNHNNGITVKNFN